jgi:dihydroneopterin aldolase
MKERPNVDTIQIAGLQTFGYHGLFEEERRLGQKFTFDIDATLNPAPTHRDDSLDASIRYDAVVDLAVSLAGEMTYQTLEALGEAIGLLRRFALIDNISVGVAKFSPRSRMRSARSGSRCAWRVPSWPIGRVCRPYALLRRFARKRNLARRPATQQRDGQITQNLSSPSRKNILVVPSGNSLL